ncbi:MAG: ArsA-related P-loop ATPase [Infirmifilum sp.]|uniref:ATP-binding protein n=1 Tax=Infirmifilum sp. TaxID=2856575 RepID=UPI003D096F09
MRVLVTGKGGTGKTSISAALSIQLSESGFNVLALDADSYPNLARSYGLPLEVIESIVPLVDNEELVKERTGAAPGEGWGLFFSLSPKVDDIVDKFSVKINDNLRLVVVGGIEDAGEGCMCPSIAFAKAFLMHVLLTSRDIVLIDSEAGLEVMGRALGEQFEMNLCVAEPTLKALDACGHILDMSQQLNIRDRALIINKVKNMKATEKLLDVFQAKHPNTPFFTIRFDPKLEEVEQTGASIEISRDSTFWTDVSAVTKFVKSRVK